MLFYVVPAYTHPIYIEWQKWRHICEAQWTPQAQEAKDSIERIAEHAYPDHPAIIGHMIMMDDTEQMEHETAATGGARDG